MAGRRAQRGGALDRARRDAVPAVNQVNAPTFPFHAPLDGRPDAFGTPAVSWSTDNPPDQVTRIRAGGDLGWPFCTPGSTRPAVAGTLLGLPFVADAFHALYVSDDTNGLIHRLAPPG